jgi:predicted nucleic acid-binding protein
MADYLLDCNHLAAAIRKTSVVRDRIQQGARAGRRFVSCHPVLCELEVGIQQTAKPSDYRRRLTLLLRHVRLWSLDADSARLYGETYHELRRKGRALSQVDIMLAALGRQHKLTVLTTDLDFNALPDVPVEDWTIEAKT